MRLNKLSFKTTPRISAELRPELCRYQGCMHDFVQKNIDEFVRLHPRTEALETPILDPVKKTTVTEYGYRYTDTKIEVDETRQT